MTVTVSEDVVQRVVSYIQYQATKPAAAIAEMVADSQSRLAAIFDAVSEDTASQPEAEGQWCLRELIRHVIDAEEYFTSLVENLARGREYELRSGIGSMVADEGQPFSAFVARLRTANDGMLAAIRGLPEAPDTQSRAPNPLFGPLNSLEWAVCQRVHDADHIQHSQKILAAVRS